VTNENAKVLRNNERVTNENAKVLRENTELKSGIARVMNENAKVLRDNERVNRDLDYRVAAMVVRQMASNLELFIRKEVDDDEDLHWKIRTRFRKQPELFPSWITWPVINMLNDLKKKGNVFAHPNDVITPEYFRQLITDNRDTESKSAIKNLIVQKLEEYYRAMSIEFGSEIL
jgi:hypothetical protein